MSNEDTTDALAAPAREMGLVPTTFEEAKALSTTLASSRLLPDALQKSPADVLVTIMAGQELGLSPMASIRGIHVIKGRPTLSADMMVALIRRSGLCEYFIEIESTNERAVFETRRKGSPQPQRGSFTVEEARAAGLFDKSKSLWPRYTKALLRARAKSITARGSYEDLLFGVYTPDELDAEAIDLVETSPGSYSPPPPPTGSPPPAPTPDSPSAPVSPTPGAETPRESAPADAVIDVEFEPAGEPEDEFERELADLEKQIRHAAHKPEAFDADAMKALFQRGMKLPKGPDRQRLSKLYQEAEQVWRDAQVEYGCAP